MKTEDKNLETAPYQAPLDEEFVFAEIKVLPQLNRLEDQNSGTQTALEPRLMHLLCFLAANQHKVLDRDTLIKQLWPNVVVNENSLTRAVSELRKHLKSSNAQTSTLIETIPKKGYRLICPGPQSSGQVTGLTSPIRARLGLKHWLRHRPKALSGTALAASMAMIVMLPALPTFNQAQLQENERFKDEVIVTEPSYLGGEVRLSASQLPLSSPKTTRPVISHDGASFAYLSYDATGSTVFHGSLAEMVNPLPIYHDSDKLVNLAWSPTGGNLLFAKKPTMATTALFSSKGNELELLTLNPLTGEIQRLVKEASEPANSGPSDQNLT